MGLRWSGVACIVVLAACEANAQGQASGAAESVGPTSGAASSSGTTETRPGDSTVTTTGQISTSSPTTMSDPDTGQTTTTGPQDPTAGDSSSGTGPGVQATLPTLRIELPCMNGTCEFSVADVCFMVPNVDDIAVLDGAAGTIYDVTIDVHGVVEMTSYIDGVLDDPVYVGGQVDSFWSPFGLTVSDPPQTYWLNPAGDGDFFTYPLDYTYTLPIAAGATVSLTGTSGDDSCGLFNHDEQGNPIMVPGVPPAPRTFDGQFVQVDAISLTPQ